MHHPLFPLSFLKNLASSFYFFLVFALTFIGSWGFETMFPFCLTIVSNFCGLFRMSKLRDQYFHLVLDALDKDYWATLVVGVLVLDLMMSFSIAALEKDIIRSSMSTKKGRYCCYFSKIYSRNEICKLDYSIWPNKMYPS